MVERSPFLQLLACRVREFRREPEVVFWVFGFPLLLAIGLGIAFRARPPQSLTVAVVEGEGAAPLVAALTDRADLRVVTLPERAAAERLRLGRIDLAVVPGATYEYRYDPTRPESVLAREWVHDRLEAAAGRIDPVAVRDSPLTEPGARYIDFLIPGLLGMNIMNGGLWGVGYAVVDMRTRRLLKRLVATPMRRTDFLGAMMASRMLLVLAELVLMLAAGRFIFGLPIRGSLTSIAVIAFLGAATFAGMGVLVASRAQKVETVSGLVNLVTLPMFIFSGVFFSWERFPALFHPVIELLPLTALNDALRATILEGTGLAAQPGRLALLAGWGAVSFAVGLGWFRWR